MFKVVDGRLIILLGCFLAHLHLLNAKLSGFYTLSFFETTYIYTGPTTDRLPQNSHQTRKNSSLKTQQQQEQQKNAAEPPHKTDTKPEKTEA